MKPAPFEYVRAASAEHACELLAQYGDEARLLAGGQSLIPMINLRLARPAVLIDVGRLPLGGVTLDGSGIRIGALTRHAELIESADLQGAAPVFAEAARYIAHPTIRRHGTIGGSIAHADPTAELPGLLALLDGEVETNSKSGTRRIAARDLFRGAFSTALKPDEMVVAAHFMPPAGRSGSSFIEMSDRDGDFAIAAVGVVVERNGDMVASARIVMLGAESIPVRANAIEAALVGSPVTEAIAATAGADAAAGQTCYSDIRATADYRRHLLAEFTRRALLAAYARAGAAA